MIGAISVGCTSSCGGVIVTLLRDMIVGFDSFGVGFGFGFG